jgi:peptidoglycan/LPS O-acetylase OafA/YrhL
VAALVVWLLVPAARRRWGGRVLVVAAIYAATMVLFVGANKLTTSASAIFLQSTAPLWVLLAGPLLLGERTRRADVTFMLAVALGMACFFVGVDAPQATAPDPGPRQRARPAERRRVGGDGARAALAGTCARPGPRRPAHPLDRRRPPPPIPGAG